MPSIMAETSDPSSTAHHHRNIEKAAKTEKILEALGSDEFNSYTHDGSILTAYCRTKAKMDSKVLKWAFKLAETNVAPFYKTGPIGWQPKQKQSDLNKNWARYFVLNDAAKRPVAYTMFRFDLDYGCSVLYCYELQIERDYQRKGVGRFMIRLLERLARHFAMEKLILTVLDNNQNAIDFFTSMGFGVDDTSPSELNGYKILSKIMSQ